MRIFAKTDSPAPELWIHLAVFLAVALVVSFASASPRVYSYGEACEKALPYYRQGWAEILENGRWTEAERLYRKAVAVSPNCFIAKSVLARITLDATERTSLIAQIQSSLNQVDAHGRLILDPYLKTLILISARDTGESLSEGFRSDLTQMAIDNYRSFLEEYPDEWAVRVEYIEWVHAEQGPRGALEAIGDMSAEYPGNRFRWSYFPASFYAELGDYEQATTMADRFIQELGPEELPQKYYIRAFINYERGDYASAAQWVKQALLLDPRHLIAQRLSRKIAAALADME